MTTKYDMTKAAAKRIAARLAQDPTRVTYDAVVSAIDAEGFYKPTRQVADLIRELSDEHPGMAAMIGREAAHQARQLSETLFLIRQGLRAAGCVFEDDVKPEALAD